MLKLSSHVTAIPPAAARSILHAAPDCKALREAGREQGMLQHGA
jgi:hypothetical protein